MPADCRLLDDGAEEVALGLVPEVAVLAAVVEVLPADVVVVLLLVNVEVALLVDVQCTPG